MKAVGKWVEDLRKSKKMSRADVMRVTGLSAATIVRLEGGDGGKSRSSVLAIGKALGLEPEAAEALAMWAAGSIDFREFERRGGSRYAVKATEFTPSDFAVVDSGQGTPILGEVTAGGMVESLVFDNGDEPDRVPVTYPGRHRTYALRIRGDSMSPEYRPGEVLLCQDAMRDDLDDGEDAVIQLDGSGDGRSTFKRCVFLGGGRVKLMALNASYAAAECDFESIVRIGKVLGVYRPLASRKGGNS